MGELSRRQKTIIFITVLASLLFVGLSMTVVNTAIPRIVSIMGGMEYYSWVLTIFIFTSSVTSLLVGKVSDTFGRKPFLLVGLAIFMAGSFCAGLSSNIFQLIISRGVQGVGGGMILITSFAAVGDLFPPRERARWQGLLSGAFGLASIAGPTLGGYIVDNADWCWVFWIFLPAGIVAFFLIARLFPPPQEKGADAQQKHFRKIDFAGALLLAAFVLPLLLFFNWGGDRFAWHSLELLGLLTVSLLALTGFLAAEKRAENPIMPLKLFKNKVFFISALVSLLIGVGFFSVMMYAPLLFQGVMAVSPTVSGLMIMPMMVAMFLASTLFGQLVARSGSYKAVILLGLAVMSIGTALLAMMDQGTALIIGALYMVVIGLGMGACRPIVLLTAQNAVEDRELGVATSTAHVSRQLGGVIGVSLLDNIMNYRLSLRLGQLSRSGKESLLEKGAEAGMPLKSIDDVQVLMNPEKLAHIQASLPAEMDELFPEMLELLRTAFNYSLTGVFVISAAVMAAALLIAFFMEEKMLRIYHEK